MKKGRNLIHASATIHPTAIIEEGAEIAANVTVGPYCIVGAQVKLAEGVVLHSHVVVTGDTRVGAETQIFPFASIGHPPQDKKFNGEKSQLVIGERNMIREHVTMNPGTSGGGMITNVGNDCLFMASTHVAHDCQVGNRVILANNATLAGHVVVGDGAIIGGLSAVHQFVRIGTGAFVGGMSAVAKDIIPYGTVTGERATLEGLNLVGLKRSTMARDDIHALRHLFKALFLSNDGTLMERATKLRSHYSQPGTTALLDFILTDTSRSFCTPKDVGSNSLEDAA
ncbi:MAG: acyl-[acyl-carrier-protein]--UDP-N-acetylglucosamine O-acyltransferase [Rhodospirillales bacterium 12-54-5]|nr:MAG: acyl-[acyl-carrier-protein]--UDP-N-acetylglucosamine O-acyltransferase [Rhodospirillales bacterium 12-54-5]